jgi:hypothetical protein
MRAKKFLKTSLLVVLIATAFWVGTAYAATGCFTDTNGHAYETAICWLKANGIVSGTTFSPNTAATRATVAQWLFKQVQIPPTTGTILITPGSAGWQKSLPADNLTFTYYSNSTAILKATAGTAYITLQPSIPTALYGRSLKLLGVEFCYAASSDAVLDYVEINTFNSATGEGTRTIQFSDDTNRTDTACRYYVLPTAVILTPKDGVNMFVRVNWTLASTALYTTRTTFVLAPTGAKIVPPSADSPEAVILTESDGSGAGSETTAP